MSSTGNGEYYDTQLAAAQEYQDWLCREFAKRLYFVLSPTCSRKYQYEAGETWQGAEIKFDKKFHETGNLFIEVAEKTNPRNADYVPSGICRRDNTWLYVIGDYRTVFVFDKKWLQRVRRSGKVKVFDIDRGTSRGFLLTDKWQSHAMLRLNWDNDPLHASIGRAAGPSAQGENSSE